MYSLNLMRIALELAEHNHVYEDIASKFFEHFLNIAEAMSCMYSAEIGLWDEETNSSMTCSTCRTTKKCGCASAPWWA